MKPLTEAVKQFMYTHMRQTPHAKELLKMIEGAEDQYIDRINQLESRVDDRDPAVMREENDRKNLNGGTRDEEYPDRDWGNFD